MINNLLSARVRFYTPKWVRREKYHFFRALLTFRKELDLGSAVCGPIDKLHHLAKS
jgi:hypothetical protein